MCVVGFVRVGKREREEGGGGEREREKERGGRFVMVGKSCKYMPVFVLCV